VTGPVTGEVPGGRAAGDDVALPSFARRPVLAVAAVMVMLELAVASRYGIHRDELYFLASARHLAWGYVDQPPLVPAVAWVTLKLFGPSAFWLRALPALAGGAAVVVTALTARQLGGAARAQTLAAVAVAAAPQDLAGFHLLSTTAFDMFFWSVLGYLVTRLLLSGERRLWLAIGAVVGLALLNKLNVGYLVVGVIAGMLTCRQWLLLRSGWLLGGAAVAAAIASPDVAWNVAHQWAQLAMLHSLHSENSGVGASFGFIPAQFIVMGPATALVWLPGLRRLLSGPVGRPLGIAFLVLLVVYAVAGAKSYYLAGMYYPLFAAGGVWFEERLAGRRSAWMRHRIALVVAGAALALPLTLPVLPESGLATGSWEGAVNKDLSATVGWPDFVRQIALTASRLPGTDRRRLVIYTGDYGAAGAIDLYGPGYGLPQAISGHNSFWWWGPGRAPDDSATIAVGLPRAYLLTLFRHVQAAGQVTTPGGVWTEERGAPIWICTGQVESWAKAWPAARHYD
jgi:4-amino-4-deoxy-L-arabinose transferase-like glycosyltransferase